VGGSTWHRQERRLGKDLPAAVEGLEHAAVAGTGHTTRVGKHWTRRPQIVSFDSTGNLRTFTQLYTPD